MITKVSKTISEYYRNLTFNLIMNCKSCNHPKPSKIKHHMISSNEYSFTINLSHLTSPFLLRFYDSAQELLSICFHEIERVVDEQYS